MPIFFDVLYWAMSIQNMIVNLFIVLCLRAFLNKEYTQSNFFLVAAIFSSALEIIFLPIWFAFALIKKTNYKLYITPLIVAVSLKLVGDGNVKKNPFFNDSILSNLNLSRIKETYLAFSAPFNFHLTTYQFIISTFMVVIICIICIDYFKKLINQTTNIREDFLIGIILYSLGCFIASFLIRQVTEIRYLLYSCFYIPLSLIYLIDMYRSVILSRLLTLTTIINYLVVLTASAEILPGVYIEKIIRQQNISRNHFDNFFPTDEIRMQSEALSKKREFSDRPKFEIPNGINGSIPQHLFIFNEFIGYARNMIYLPASNSNSLQIIENQTVELKSIENKPTGKLKEVLNLSIPKNHFNEFYKVVLSSPHKQFNYFLRGNYLNKIDKNHHLIIYSNQMPYGKFKVNVVKLALKHQLIQ
jgi:hypothetical protein